MEFYLLVLLLAYGLYKGSAVLSQRSKEKREKPAEPQWKPSVALRETSSDGMETAKKKLRKALETIRNSPLDEKAKARAIAAAEAKYRDALLRMINDL